jgi:hypothetical protein
VSLARWSVQVNDTHRLHAMAPGLVGQTVEWATDMGKSLWTALLH